MPAHNAENTIAEAMDSVLKNTFTDFELVVVDDGSTDATRDVVGSIQDDRVRLLEQPHAGLVTALNQGVSHCRAGIIARMDADDICDANRFELQMGALEDPSIAIVGGRVNIVDRTGSPVETWARYESWINDNVNSNQIRSLRFVESPLVHPTVMARSEVFHLGYRDGDFPEDYDLWLRAFAAGFEAIKVSEVVLSWVDDSSRLTRRHKRYSGDSFDRCRREHLLHGPLKNVHDVILWGAGQTGKPWLRWLQSEKICVRHVIDVDPGKIGQSIHNVPVIDPGDVPSANGEKIIAAVGAAGARELITEHLVERDYEIGKDVWFVA